MRRLAVTLSTALICSNTLCAQSLLDDIDMSVEATAVTSSGEHSPFWLSSNKYGMSSIENGWANERIAVSRSLESDSLRNWKRGYGIDVALMQNSTSNYFIQQAYFDLQWKKLKLTVGSKEQPIELKNNELTSGGMSFGMNAHSIPQARLDIDYFSMPGTNGWWKVKMFGSYGMTTDGSWQKSFAAADTKYTSNTLYHEKAIFLKFGKEDHPRKHLTFVIGLQMAAQFGGTSYNIKGRTLSTPTTIDHPEDAKAFWNALICSGSDATDGRDPNTAGNHLGSYNLELAWHGKGWKLKGYMDRFFDDQSNLTTQYGIYDCLLGINADLPKNPYVSSIVVEHIGTRNQSGAVYKDESATLPDKMDGRDNYYNHNIYTGWQHWGMAIGNPLLTSPIYNNDHLIYFHNNRIEAWHIGLSGDPLKELHYRVLFSFSENWGTYEYPFREKKHLRSYLAELTFSPKKLNGWVGQCAFGYDHGSLIGNNTGFLLSVKKNIKLR